jgi:hypothetical protein
MDHFIFQARNNLPKAFDLHLVPAISGPICVHPHCISRTDNKIISMFKHMMLGERSSDITAPSLDQYHATGAHPSVTTLRCAIASEELLPWCSCKRKTTTTLIFDNYYTSNVNIVMINATFTTMLKHVVRAHNVFVYCSPL